MSNKKKIKGVSKERDKVAKAILVALLFSIGLVILVYSVVTRPTRSSVNSFIFPTEESVMSKTPH